LFFSCSWRSWEPEHVLVLHQPADPESGRPHDRDDPDLGSYYGWNWVFVLDEIDRNNTRLIVRSWADGRSRYLIKAFYALFLESCGRRHANTP